jgi:hypothetical protein
MSIAEDIATHVTKIYGRDEMHALMDLVFHSVLAFPFDGKVEARGWLDCLVVGDTRTGKTEAAKRLIAWYGAGEYVSCEAASFAGVVGGLEQHNSKEWAVRWGAVPINDRRLVVLDEASGLTVEQIAQMSSIRSSGEAQLTKIQSERTHARTRLLWLGNPREGKALANYTYGVQAIPPLIGNNEDVARFDLAMSVAEKEVASEDINRHRGSSKQRYSQAACLAAVQWSWSRRAEDITWERGAEQLVYTLAIEMGNRYVPQPPLVQAANIRMKIARVAVALATRLVSTDKTFTKVIVTKRHVQDAVGLMDKLYSMPGFGYRAISNQYLERLERARANKDKARKFIKSTQGLEEFLIAAGSVWRRSDMEDTMNLRTDDASAVCNTLFMWGMLMKPTVSVFENSPILHDILRESQ